VAQARTGLLDVAAPPAFPRLVGDGARLAAGTVGSPPTWPASWIFAARHGLSPARYDALVGRYLFYRQNNLQGRIAVGDGDGALLGEGWSAPADVQGRAAREVRARARVLAPLDEPEDLGLDVHAFAAAPAAVELRVNGRRVAAFTAGPTWARHGAAVPSAAWRRDLNDVELVAAAPVWIASIEATRAGARPGEERGFVAR
jgi:hypothetical protein